MKVVVCVIIPYTFACRFAKVCELPHLELGMAIRAHVEDDVWCVTVDTIETSTESEMLIAYCDFRDENMTRKYEDNPRKCERIFTAFAQDASWRAYGDYPETLDIPDGPSEKDCLEMIRAYATEKGNG